jgi:galactoside O-acetyltransferase
VFDRVKRFWWGIWLDSKGVEYGRLFSCIPPCYVSMDNGGKVVFGDRVSLNHNVSVNANDGGEIIIGDGVAIGMNAVLRASNHDYKRMKGHITGKIVVGNNVWIGANCVILPGVTIGEGSVIGAGSIVTRDIPENVVAVGNPCRVKSDIERGGFI